jgi:hypothetical protein
MLFLKSTVFDILFNLKIWRFEDLEIIQHITKSPNHHIVYASAKS